MEIQFCTFNNISGFNHLHTLGLSLFILSSTLLPPFVSSLPSLSPHQTSPSSFLYCLPFLSPSHSSFTSPVSFFTFFTLFHLFCLLCLPSFAFPSVSSLTCSSPFFCHPLIPSYTFDFSFILPLLHHLSFRSLTLFLLYLLLLFLRSSPISSSTTHSPTPLLATSSFAPSAPYLFLIYRLPVIARFLFLPSLLHTHTHLLSSLPPSCSLTFSSNIYYSSL